MPWLDYLFFKNPILHKVRKEKASPVVTFSMARANERLEELEKNKGTTIKDRDFLSGFINAMAKDPSIPKSYVFFLLKFQIQFFCTKPCLYLQGPDCMGDLQHNSWQRHDLHSDPKRFLSAPETPRQAPASNG
jgi:hypothetical protein